MEMKMSFKQMKPSNGLKTFTKDKSERLEKYFRGKISVTWNFVVEKQEHVAHCHVVGNSLDFFGEGRTDNMHSSVEVAMDRIEKQLRKQKEIVRDHLHKQGHRTPAKAGRAKDEEDAA